jgi:tetratricopeptide (TPR) repeat protein
MSENNHNLRFLEEHIKEHPESLLFARLADAYLKDQKITEAISVCEEGLKRYPFYVTGHLILGKCYLANKSYDQAEKEFKRVLFFDPKYLAAHKFYGDLMQEIGWENTCESSYKKILQIDPLDEVARSRVDEISAKGTPTPEKPAEQPAPEPSPSASTTSLEIDFDAISPVALDEIEEEVALKEPVTEPTPPVAPAAPAAPPAKPADMDDKKIEEFSGILDDIFKDEVVKGNAAGMQIEEEEMVSQFQGKTKNFVDDFDAYRPEPELPQQTKTQPPPPPPEVEDFDIDFTPQHIEQREPYTPPPKPRKEDSQLFSNPKPKKGEKIVTPTLGEIYAAQGQYSKAIDVFEVLMKKYPNNEAFPGKIKILKQKLEEQRNAPKN